MVLQVFADRQVRHHRNAHLVQMIGRSDARQHQQVRRVERARGKNDFLRGFRLHHHAVVLVFDARRARSLHGDAQRMRLDVDPQVAAAAYGLEEGIGGRRAAPVSDRVLAAPEAFAAGAVVVRRHGELRGLGGLDPGRKERIVGLGPFSAQWPVAAAVGALAADPCLAAFEVRQDLRIGPALRAVARPAVVIAAMAPRVGHHVHRRRAAQHLAARRLDAAAIQLRLGLGVEAPVMHVMLVHLAHAERDVDERIPVAPACLEQQHPRAFVLGEPVRQNATGRAGADDDVVIGVLRRSHVVVSPEVQD